MTTKLGKSFLQKKRRQDEEFIYRSHGLSLPFGNGNLCCYHHDFNSFVFKRVGDKGMRYNTYELNKHSEETIYLGIDNGVTGSIGVIQGEYYNFFKVESFSSQSYTKKKQNISRINFPKLNLFFRDLSNIAKVVALLENPASVNNFKVVQSSMRCFEATIIALEINDIPYSNCTAGEWQKELIPGAIKKNEELRGDKFKKERTENLKTASMVEGIKLCPLQEELITKNKDADGLLIAEWLRLNK